MHTIIQKSEFFIQQLFKEKLSEDFLFHDLAHTKSVRENSLKIGILNDLSKDDLEILDIASWFHDAGYTELYSGHENASCEIVKNFLAKENYPPEKTQKVLDCIDATRTGYEPKTLLQKIIKDADLGNLGMVTFSDLNAKLRYEWDKICGNQYSDLEWHENNVLFLNDHQFYTKEAQKMWDEGKQKNIEMMKELVELAREEESGHNQSS